MMSNDKLREDTKHYIETMRQYLKDALRAMSIPNPDWEMAFDSFESIEHLAWMAQKDIHHNVI